MANRTIGSAITFVLAKVKLVKIFLPIKQPLIIFKFIHHRPTSKNLLFFKSL